MSLYPSSYTVEHFHADDGTLLSGGALEYYIAGTTTPTPVYVDSARTEAGTTLTLNDRGEPEVSSNAVIIWLDSDVNYKVVGKNASGGTEWTIDNLAAANTADSGAEIASADFSQWPVPSVNGSDTDHDIDFSSGKIADSTGAELLILPSTMTKQIDASWALGNNAGGLFSGTVAASTTYYCFLIEANADQSIDCGFDTSSTAANIPAGYTKYRRIASFETDSSANIDSSSITLLLHAEIARRGLSFGTCELDGNSFIPTSRLDGYRRKNLLINGNFDIWQRDTSFTDPDATYTADRWVGDTQGSGSDNGVVSRQSFTLGQTDVPAEPTYFLRWNSTTGVSSDLSAVRQRVEDVRTLAGQTVTASVYLKASKAVTLNIILTQKFGSGGSSDVAAISEAVNVTTSWQRFTITGLMPSVAGKTIGSGSHVDFAIVELTSDGNGIFSFDIAQAQLELGSTASSFEKRPIGEDLELCKRYYEKIAEWRFNGQCISSTQAHSNIFYTEKRVEPTVSANVDGNITNSAGVSGAATGVSFSSQRTKGALATVTVASGLAAGNATQWVSTASTHYIEVDAEI